MSNQLRDCSLFVGMWAVAFLAGCGGQPGDGYTGERGQVSGTVTYDGKPIPKGCQVIFVAKDHGYTASGVVDDTGAFKLIYQDKAGLPVGEYLVQLTAPVVVSEPSTGPVDPVQMAAKMKLTRKTSGEGADGPFPTKYLSTSSSKLTEKVEPGENDFEIKLEK